jgi:hypothetical protein
MLMLNHRLQVLIDDERYDRLRQESERIGTPVGELVRRAIDREFPADAQRRRAAGEFLLSLPMPPGSQPDWETIKDDPLDELAARWYA